MKELNVEFGEPENGWIEISVSDGVNAVVVEVDAKSHSFYELTTALLNLKVKEGCFSVAWLEEPGVTEWRFANADGEVVFELWRSVGAEPVLRAKGAYEEVCVPFWRALQALKDRFPEAELEERTQDAFPFAPLEMLGQSIRSGNWV